ncbi:MAG: glycosyltransferase family 4 protein [Opitutales bacterium]
MKILWISNSPTMPSGYGSQTRQVGLRIAKAGYEIEFSANDGTRGDQEWNGLRVYGSGTDQYSRDAVREDFRRSGADVILSLYDAWVYVERGDPFEGLPHVYSWMPIDHYPAPPPLYPWLIKHQTIAMSKFGHRTLVDTANAFIAQGQPMPMPDYVPHALEDVWRPEDGAAFRKIIDVPRDAFLVGIVAANYGGRFYDRKGWGDMIAALGPFMRAHPDAYVYLHTLEDTQTGVPIPMALQAQGVPAERVRWADQYALKKMAVSDEQMARIYSSFDVLLSTSRGEGFGLCVLEAQACGTPVIVSNWTAQPELVGEPFDAMNLRNIRYPNGWVVAVDPDWDWRQAASGGKPQIGSILGALQDALAHKGDQAMRDAALLKASDYRADDIFASMWLPLLKRIEGLVDKRPRRERREEQRRLARASA